MYGFIRTFICALILLPLVLLAQARYILDNRDGLLMPNTIGFIEKLSNELFNKTSFSLYVAAVNSTPLIGADSQYLESSIKRRAYKDSLKEGLTLPYAIMVFMKEDKKIDIISSHPGVYFDEDRVYFEYMIPLLPKKKDEPLSPQRISAVLLNGYAEAADMIASHYDVKLENNMSIDERGGREFVKFCMYVMLLIMFGLIGIIYLRRNKS